MQLLEDLYHTIYACHYHGEASLLAIDITQIKGLVAMVPYYKVMEQGEIVVPSTKHFLVEKPHLELTFFCPLEDVDREDDNDREE